MLLEKLRNVPGGGEQLALQKHVPPALSVPRVSLSIKCTLVFISATTTLKRIVKGEFCASFV